MTQPRRHKKGGGHLVCMSWLFADRKDNVDRRWMREEHVLQILSETHVPGNWDGSYVAEIAWRYYEQFDYARLCLGIIIIMYCLYFCWNLSLILVSLWKMLVFKCLILKVVICKPLWKVKRLREHNMYSAESAI